MATLHICGNASAAPPAGGACSAYLVETAGTKLLLDIGPGSLARIREATDVHDLDGIVISHMHTDHFLDLLALNVARFTSPGARADGGARWRLPVWVPPGARATIEACFRALQVNVRGTTASRWEENFDVREYDPDEVIAVNELAVSFVGPTKHAQLDYGMRVDVGGRVLAYTGDTAFCQAAIEIGRGADVFLAECTLMEPGPASETHTASHELVEMAAEARPGQLLATHFVDHSHGWREELRARLGRALSMPSHVVQVGDRFEF
jgi:ribonuclease BN (tRNA processing enzyme)